MPTAPTLIPHVITVLWMAFPRPSGSVPTPQLVFSTSYITLLFQSLSPCLKKSSTKPQLPALAWTSGCFLVKWGWLWGSEVAVLTAGMLFPLSLEQLAPQHSEFGFKVAPQRGFPKPPVPRSCLITCCHICLLQRAVCLPQWVLLAFHFPSLTSGVFPLEFVPRA